MQLKSFASVIAIAATAISVLAKEVTYYWDIGYVKAAPDGFSRQVIGVNGVWPPPPIYASLNDTIIVETRNSLDVPTTLHAHGLYHNGTNYMDGPYMITQCGIPPGSNMTYRYDITQTGTYWIHSHYGAQYVNGLRAPLIINDPDEPYDYDEDIILTLDDWYQEDAELLAKSFLSWKNPGGAEPVPDGALIGGDGGDKIHTIKFEPGKTYRIRLINMSALAMFHFSIDGHKMRVIEVDGVNTEEQEVGNIRLSAAQRTSILVTALNSTDNNFIFHADMDTDMFDSIPDGLNYNSTGIIQYDENAPVKQTDAIDWSPFEDINLVPYDKTPAMGFDVSYTLDVYFNQFTDALNHGTFNNISFVSPQVPSMFSALTLDDADSFNPHAYGPQTNPRVLRHMNEVQLVVGNYDAGTHPFHLHGHHFQIIERGPVPYDSTFNPRPKTPPIRRDTVIIPSMEYVILRFRADNPGAWLFHCHIDWHMLGGLNMVFIEAPDKMKERIKVPQQVLDHCKAAGIATSGNAAGKEGLDLTGLPEGPSMYPLGWTRKAKGAMAGCVLSAIVGILSIIWYGWSSKDQYSRVPTEDAKLHLQSSERNQFNDDSKL